MKMTHLLRRFSFALTAGAIMTFGFAHTQAFAQQNTLDKIKERGTLVAGVKAEYPPFGFMTAGGEHAGFDVDIAHQFAKDLLGDENAVKFVSVTTGNRVPYLQSDKIDIILASMTITDARSEVVDFSKPYFYSGGLLLVPKNSDISGVDDLDGKSVAIIQGSVQDAALQELAPGADLVKFSKVSQAVLALKTRRVDAYAHDDIVILSLVEKNPDLKTVGKAFKPQPFGIAVRKNDDALLKWVDDEMDHLRQTGDFDRLWSKYFGALEANLVKPDSDS